MSSRNSYVRSSCSYIAMLTWHEITTRYLRTDGTHRHWPLSQNRKTPVTKTGPPLFCYRIGTSWYQRSKLRRVQNVEELKIVVLRNEANGNKIILPRSTLWRNEQGDNFIWRKTSEFEVQKCSFEMMVLRMAMTRPQGMSQNVMSPSLNGVFHILQHRTYDVRSYSSVMVTATYYLKPYSILIRNTK